MRAPRLLGLLALAPLALAGLRCGGVAAGGGQTYCAKACATDADCCPDGAVDCPGPYPKNFACDGGLCRAPHCVVDADCDFTPGLACRVLAGLASCVRACTTDADCEASGGLAGGTCTGQADDGSPLCVATIPPCTSDADCLGDTHCRDDGRCGCRDDADCTGGLTRCADGICACASDAECGPKLDRCVSDPAFRYPPSAAPGKP